MPASEERFSRLEAKVDRLQDQAHQNHLELLSCISKANDAIDDEINALKLKTERHDSYFSGIVKVLGLGGAVSSWLAIKDLFGAGK